MRGAAGYRWTDAAPPLRHLGGSPSRGRPAPYEARSAPLMIHRAHEM